MVHDTGMYISYMDGTYLHIEGTNFENLCLTFVFVFHSCLVSFDLTSEWIYICMSLKGAFADDRI